MNEKDKYIRALEDRIQLLANEKSRLSLLDEMFKNFEQVNGLDEIIDTILHDAMELHGGQNVLLFYKMNMKWQFRDLYGNESIVNIEDFPELKHVLECRQYHEVIHRKVTEEDTININLEGLNTCTSYYPLNAKMQVIAILVLEERLIYNEVSLGDLTTFFNYAGIVLENAIRNLSKLENATAEFEQIFHSNINGMILVDTEGKVLRCNHATYELTGCKYSELKGKIINIIPELKSLSPRLKMLIKNNQEQCELDIQIVNRGNGKVLDCIASLSQLKDNTNSISGIIINIKDISSRRQAELKLMESEERYNLAMKAANEGIFDLNLITNEIYYSPKWKSILGYEDHELQNDFSVWEKLIDPADIKRAGDMNSELISKKRDRFVLEIKMKHKNGHWVDILTRAEMVFDESGKAARMIGTNQDISEQKLIEKELLNAKHQAEESDRLKSAFLANMSHEIRTPMNGILGFASLLKTPELPGHKKDIYLDIIQQSGNRMLNTVNDIIEVSKIETGQVDVILDRVDIKQQIDFLSQFFTPEIEGKGMYLKVENHLAETENYIVTDEVKLNSILTNLVKNAIKYSNRGYIKIGVKKSNDQLQFNVEDSGLGIPLDRQDAIFDRFVQADIEDRNVHQGSGLGLAIVKSYVEMLGGEIWLESSEAVGSNFFFTIDYTGDKDPLFDKQLKGGYIKKDRIAESMILIAEDDDVSYLLLDSILSQRKCRIFRAENGKSAVELCSNSTKFDLVMMDVKMPVMDGLEATRKIREFNKTIPIIAQTSYAMSSDKQTIMEAGCNDYISKPINEQELLMKIQKLL